MKRDLPAILQGIGFRPTEAKVYLATLELGDSLASEIAKKARVKRASTYVILKALIKRGFMASYRKRGLTHFVAHDPHVLVRLAVERARAAEEVLPELHALLQKPGAKSKPRIQFFEDIEGLKTVMEDTITESDHTILAWADPELALNTMGKYYNEYNKKRVEREVRMKSILEDDKVARIYKQRGIPDKREVKIVPAKEFNMSNEIFIYGDKVAIISHQDLIGVIIQNKAIADTQRVIFNLSWLAATELDKNIV